MLAQVKHQVIGAQTRYVSVGVKTFQRVVKIIGQENRFDVAFVQDHLWPLGIAHFFFCCVVQRFPIRLGDSVVLKIKERLTDTDQPLVVSCVFDIGQSTNQSAHQFTWLDSVFFDLRFGHPGRVNEFGVVVVTQNVRQRGGRGCMGVDVCMGVNQTNRSDGFVDRFSCGLKHCLSRGLGLAILLTAICFLFAAISPL